MKYVPNQQNAFSIIPNVSHIIITYISIICVYSSLALGENVEDDIKCTRNANIREITKSYRRVVHEFVYAQTQSWNRHFNLQRDHRSQYKHRPLILDNEPELAIMKEFIDSEVLNATTSTAPSKMGSDHINDNSSSLNNHLNDIIWDDKEDISSYFDTLMNNCQRSAKENRFNDDCWGFLNSLIDNPRCTVRLDSRFTCHHQRQERQTTTVESLIKSHFLDNTTNILIIGAGPVGLHLANVLTDHSLFQSNSNDTSEGEYNHNIRVLVFDNRLISPGLKHGYSRDWITDIEAESFYGHGDPRIFDFYQVMHNTSVDEIDEQRTRLPINVLETLLLLSNRERGVKFVYDNYEDYKSLFLALDNVIAFDATGHRLNELDEADDFYNIEEWTPRLVPHAKRKNKWVLAPDPSATKIKPSEYAILNETGNVIKVGERVTKDGSIVLQPVSNDGMPYRVHFLKISDVRGMDNDDYSRLEMLAFQAAKTDNEDWCSNLCMNEQIFDDYDYDYAYEYEYCMPLKFCKLHFLWDAYKGFREDINERFNVDHPGFCLTAYFLNLSPEQADAFTYLFSNEKMKTIKHNLNSADAARRRHRYEICDLPIYDISTSITFQQNDVATILQYLDNFALDEQSFISLFTYRPYMYKDPLVPGGLFGDNDMKGGGGVMLLRIGDSLFSGDPNASSGLNHHLWVIKLLVDELRQTAAGGALGSGVAS